jgi:hypothetical protein
MIAFARGDAGRLPFPDGAFGLTVGSPPYSDCRMYLEDGTDPGVSRPARAWVEWMLRVTAECLRVTRGPVVWVVGCPTRDRTYQPIAEGLAWRWFAEGWTERGPGTVRDGSAYRPTYWHRPGIPGSGGDQSFRMDVEACLLFKRPGALPFAEPTATGQVPKWNPGGALSYRDREGRRVNGKPQTMRDPYGTLRVQVYEPPAIANPGTLFSTGAAGGGKLGHSLAHDGEAPYPVAVPARFVLTYCPPGGLTLDPFSGSGTTAQACRENGRRCVGLDLRMSQCRLGRRRLATVTPSLPFGDSA